MVTVIWSEPSVWTTPTITATNEYHVEPLFDGEPGIEGVDFERISPGRIKVLKAARRKRVDLLVMSGTIRVKAQDARPRKGAQWKRERKGWLQ